MFYILTGYLLSTSDAARRRIEVVTLSMLGMWTALGFAVMQTSDEALRNSIIGNAGMVNPHTSTPTPGYLVHKTTPSRSLQYACASGPGRGP